MNHDKLIASQKQIIKKIRHHNELCVNVILRISNIELLNDYIAHFGTLVEHLRSVPLVDCNGVSYNISIDFGYLLDANDVYYTVYRVALTSLGVCIDSTLEYDVNGIINTVNYYHNSVYDDITSCDTNTLPVVVDDLSKIKSLLSVMIPDTDLFYYNRKIYNGRRYEFKYAQLNALQYLELYELFSLHTINAHFGPADKMKPRCKSSYLVIEINY
jgi:hypothetical protein